MITTVIIDEGAVTLNDFLQQQRQGLASTDQDFISLSHEINSHVGST